VSNDLFPSGPWTGFYTYSGHRERHGMQLQLTFTAGAMTGDGSDAVGPFLIKGRYDCSSLECHWTKSYIGGHDVSYRGFREGKGIWGRWEIGLWAHGGFHIWPEGAGAGEAKAEEASEPVVAVAREESCVSTRAFGFALVTPGIHHQKHKYNTSKDQQDQGAGLILPQLLKTLAEFPQIHCGCNLH
jgi:hypothetical protein